MHVCLDGLFNRAHPPRGLTQPLWKVRRKFPSNGKLWDTNKVQWNIYSITWGFVFSASRSKMYWAVSAYSQPWVLYFHSMDKCFVCAGGLWVDRQCGSKNHLKTKIKHKNQPCPIVHLGQLSKTVIYDFFWGGEGEDEKSASLKTLWNIYGVQKISFAQQMLVHLL